MNTLKELLDSVSEERGIILRYIPQKTRMILDIRHFEEGDTVKYLKDFKRKMVIRYRENSLGGKWLAMRQSDQGSSTNWSGDRFKEGESPEEAIRNLIESEK